MKVSRLAVRDLRNMETVSLRPSARVNIICGPNGQGKTNLLEALWLLTGQRSFRTSRDSDLVRFGCGKARVEAAVFAGGRRQEISLVLDPRRSAALNGVPLDSPGRLAGEFMAVVFSPEHLSMIKAGPVERRRFLDSAIGQVMPRYTKHLGELDRVLRQRSAVLGDLYRHPQPEDLLDVWDEHLARLGWLLMKARRRYVQRLEPKVREIYEGISHGAEELAVSYRSTVPVPEGAGDEEGLDCFRRAIRGARGEDIRMGSSSIGPHRDDLEITLGGLSARSFGSQGQQRSCALALKLAECRLIGEITGEEPIVLLDDVLSELDQGRRDYVLSGLGKQQIFITCCDLEDFSRFRRAKVFGMEAGRLTLLKKPSAAGPGW